MAARSFLSFMARKSPGTDSGRMVMSFEGWQFRLEIREQSEDI